MHCAQFSLKSKKKKKRGCCKQKGVTPVRGRDYSVGLEYPPQSSWEEG
jgi:hypothetical protein